MRPCIGEKKPQDTADVVSNGSVTVSTQTVVAENMHLDYDYKDVAAREFVEIQGKAGMKLDGLVEGTSVEWKLDTGAANTFITEDTYLSILPEH